jgi:antitoxin ParD1/3/4
MIIVDNQVATMPSSYAIGHHFEEFIDRMLASGRYANASEIVRAGLRLLEEHEDDRQHQVAEIWAKIDEGLRSIRDGRTIPAEGVFAELDRMIAERRASRDAAE